MKINEVLILEVEKHLTQDVRPGIVDAVYAKVIKEWTDTISEDDKLLLHISKLLLEFEVNFLTLQAGLLRDLISHRIVDNWGKENVLGWTDMDESHKSTLIAGHLAQKKALAKAREIFDAVPTVPGRNPQYRRDAEDIQAVRGQVLRSFLEAFV